MDTAEQELDIIAHTRSEVLNRKELTGENLFLAWGYPTAFFLFIEFIALIVWNENWCNWLWAGIPIVGIPLMMYFINEDYERTRRRTLNQNIILMMWVFIGFASFIGGFAMGCAELFEQFFCTFMSLLCGMGCYMTGIILHFKPKTICGIIGAVLSVVPLFFQGELWPWQLLITAIITVIVLIIPGHMYRHFVKQSTF
ncbi:MAG: hypothetical protein IKZ89_00060 [Bacteroidaceae bacterium]|nr:hypothetical protein [Bacteroidaceae bacterium]